jgi:uncharacterized membrane protein required for colicin V production
LWDLALVPVLSVVFLAVVLLFPGIVFRILQAVPFLICQMSLMLMFQQVLFQPAWFQQEVYLLALVPVAVPVLSVVQNRQLT